MHAKLLKFTAYPCTAMILFLVALFAVLLAIVMSKAQPLRFGIPGAHVTYVLMLASALVGLGAGIAARLRWTRSIAKSWVGWLLTPYQRANEIVVAASIATASWVATVGFFGLLIHKKGFLPIRIIVTLGCIMTVGFAVGTLFADRVRDLLARCSAWCIRLLSRQPWLALQVSNPARFALFSLPAALASTVMAFGVAASGRPAALLTCTALSAMLGAMALAELRPATPSLKKLVGWTGPAALVRIASRLAASHAFVLLALCSPLIGVGLVNFPAWGVLCVFLLSMIAWYSGLIRQVAALRPVVSGGLFAAAQSAVGLSLLLTLPFGGWLIPWHVRWLLRRGKDDWLL
jgi:hypothetical protein